MSNGKNTCSLLNNEQNKQEGEGWAPTSCWFFLEGSNVFFRERAKIIWSEHGRSTWFFSTYPNIKVNSPKIIGVICLVLVILVGGTYYTIYFEALPTKRNGSFSDDLVKICLLNSFWSCSLWVVVAGGWLCFHPLTDLLNPPVAKTHLAPKIDFTYKEFKRKP